MWVRGILRVFDEQDEERGKEKGHETGQEKWDIVVE